MPKQLIYIIDAYKLQSALIGILLVCTLSFPLTTRTENVQAAGALNSFLPAPYETYPRGKNSVAAATAVAGGSTWPLHGRVTTEFGVPHRPWQDTHTGIDISSGQRSGTAGIAAFRGGTVVKAAWSYGGYGNHVVIDHGGGVSSLYAHLASIAVSEGQTVQAGNTIGYEGSTGASTGTHLHFEVLVNGRPVSPRYHVPGTP